MEDVGGSRPTRGVGVAAVVAVPAREDGSHGLHENMIPWMEMHGLVPSLFSCRKRAVRTASHAKHLLCLSPSQVEEQRLCWP